MTTVRDLAPPRKAGRRAKAERVRLTACRRQWGVGGFRMLAVSVYRLPPAPKPAGVVATLDVGWRLSVCEWDGIAFPADEVRGHRELHLTFAALPLVLSVIAGEATPGILADWIDENPEAVADVPHRRFRWRDVPGVTGGKLPVVERACEPEWEAVAWLTRAMREATGDGERIEGGVA